MMFFQRTKRFFSELGGLTKIEAALTRFRLTPSPLCLEKKVKMLAAASGLEEQVKTAPLKGVVAKKELESMLSALAEHESDKRKDFTL